jgi:hypothetical protein
MLLGDLEAASAGDTGDVMLRSERYEGDKEEGEMTAPARDVLCRDLAAPATLESKRRKNLGPASSTEDDEQPAPSFRIDPCVHRRPQLIS